MIETITFFPLDVTYKVRNGRAVIHIYGRTIDGKMICVLDSSFDPYFYVLPTPALQDAQLAQLVSELQNMRAQWKDGLAEVTDVKKVHRQYHGKDLLLLKVITRLPGHVPIIREEARKNSLIKNCFEYDILFARRYMIDKGLVPLMSTRASGEFVAGPKNIPLFEAQGVEPSGDENMKGIKILAFDIETYNPAGKSMQPDKHPILMIAFYGMSYGKEFRKVVTWKQFRTDNPCIEFVGGELDLLRRFKEVVDVFQPDVITGYFSDGFDFPYIVERAKKYKLQLNIGLDQTPVEINTKQGVAELTGIQHIDIFKFIRRILARTMETDVFTLEAVATELLGEHKHDVDLDVLSLIWDTKPEELGKYCEYNIHDAYLTYKLCEKVLSNMEELVKLIGLPFDIATRLSFSRLVESYIMRQAFQHNELVPNRPTYRDVSQRRMQSYEGGFVFQPTAGLYENVVVFDFRSLYPSIITSHNISPGTLQCGCCQTTTNMVPGESYWFCQKRRGFLPNVLSALIERRARIKDIIKKSSERNALLEARSEVLKLLANSFYGYLGFAPARWYNLESARSITALGRHYIQQVIADAQRTGFIVLYSDTDSIFLRLDSKTKEDAQQFVTAINEKLPGIMELDYEGHYPAALFVSAKAGMYGAKKKYALLDSKGKLKIKGFETVRRNWSFIAKDVQQRVLELVLREKNPGKAVEYVGQVVGSLRKHEIPIEKVVIFTQLQRPINAYASIGPHVAVAKRMVSLGLEVGPGTVVRFVVTAGKGIVRERAKIPEEVENNMYDADYYISHQILPSVDKIFEVLGINITESVTKQSQSRLGQFFR